MIFTALDRADAYRMHSPKWAFAPTSGEGAAQNGGRVNRPGLPALYLALDPTTAVLEFRQQDPLVQPGTLVSYHVTLDRIADFRAGYSSEHWPEVWQDFFCDWRAILLNDGVEPPSWAIGDAAIAAGVKGILFPSERYPGGVNLVIYPDASVTGFDRIEVFDPGNALPKNQKSWE